MKTDNTYKYTAEDILEAYEAGKLAKAKELEDKWNMLIERWVN